MNNYLKKYLKYKKKYLQLKQTGGDYITIHDNIFIYFRKINDEILSDGTTKRKYEIEFISFTGELSSAPDLINDLQSLIRDSTGYKIIFLRILEYLKERYSPLNPHINLFFREGSSYGDYKWDDDSDVFYNKSSGLSFYDPTKPLPTNDSAICAGFLTTYISQFDYNLRIRNCDVNPVSTVKHVLYTNSLNYIFNYTQIIQILDKKIKDNVRSANDGKRAIYTAISGKDYFHFIRNDIFFISLKTDIYNKKYKRAKTDILKLIYTDCLIEGNLKICLPEERRNTNLGVYDKLVLYQPNDLRISEHNKIINPQTKLTRIIFNFLEDFKKYNTVNNLIKIGDDTYTPVAKCENNKKFLLKKNISSTGQAIHILEQCKKSEDLLSMATQIANSLITYENMKETDINTEEFLDELLKDYFFVQSFYETPFKFLHNVDGQDVMLNIRCKLRFHWSPIVIKCNNKIHYGCVIYKIPNIEAHYTTKLISNQPDPIAPEIFQKIKDSIDKFISSSKGEDNLKKLSILFTNFIDNKYLTITDADFNKNYLLSKINGADIMLLGNDNHIDEFAFLENNTGGVILGNEPYISTYLDNYLNILDVLSHEFKEKIINMTNGTWTYNGPHGEHYIYLKEGQEGYDDSIDI